MKLNTTIRNSISARILLMAALLAPLSVISSQAGSATWNVNPTSGDWNSAANWTPAAVPNGPADTATFGISNLTGVSCSASTEASGLVFNAGASAFTISPNPGTVLTISGAGITNNSATMQNFVTTADTNFNHAFILFFNNATAGSLTTFTNKAATILTYGGETDFYGNSNAGSATFVNEGSIMNQHIQGGFVDFFDNSSAASATFINNGGRKAFGYGGQIQFKNTSTAPSATFTNNGATVERGLGSLLEFRDTSTAINSTIINNGGTALGASGGATFFYNESTPGSSRLIANGGTNGGRGGEIWLDSFGDSAQVELFGNGLLNTFGDAAAGVTIGSLEGNGIVLMGPFALVIGSTDLSTTFSGTIKDSDFVGGGPLRKIGSGTLVLTGANTYTGGTTIEHGRLEVSNRRGSGVGSGPVRVRGGRLGGSGTIAGAVTVGTGIGAEAFLAPGRTAARPQTLTIQSTLTLNSDAVYNCALNSNSIAADEVVANGVTIDAAALFFLTDGGSSTLTPGTVFTVIDNSATTPITGTFSNLPDGAVVTVGSNAFQADYEGGDGNDLTLTVPP